VLVVVSVVLVTPVAGPTPWSSVDCAQAAEGELRIGIVVDVGTEPDAPGGPDVACVVVPAGSTSADVLVAWSASRGRPLRYAPSGLLCGVGGYPATGCGEPSPEGYRYWSYWEGASSGWSYSGGNPHVRPAREDRVEGWRFQAASGTGADDAPPRGPSSAICPPVSPPPPTTAAPTPATLGGATPTTAPTPGSPVGGPVAPSPAASGPAQDGTPSVDPAAATPTPRPSADAAGPTGGEVPTEAVTGGATGLDGGGTGDGVDGAGSGAGTGTTAVGAVDVIDGTEVAAAPGAPGADGSGGSVPLVALGGLGLMVGLGVAAGVRSRRGAGS
jgi:hypothetical protein